MKSLENSAVLFIADPRRLINRNSVVLSQHLYGTWLKFLASTGGPVRLSENTTDFVRVLKQDPQGGNRKCRCAQKDNAHWLPVTGLCQLFDLIPDQASFERAKMINKQHAVQMINLMTEAAGQEPFGLNFDFLALQIKAANNYF